MCLLGPLLIIRAISRKQDQQLYCREQTEQKIWLVIVVLDCWLWLEVGGLVVVEVPYVNGLWAVVWAGVGVMYVVDLVVRFG